MSLVGTDFLALSSSVSFIAFKLDPWGILGYKPTTSAVTKIELLGLLGLFFKFLISLMKSFESLIHDHPFCIIGFRWKSTNSDAFSVGVPQLEITGLPGTSDNLLWILGSK